MKKSGLLNSGLSRVVARMGHGDALLVCDAGMPRPLGVEEIDLAIVPGLPAFLDVVAAILTELQVEQYVIAQELDVLAGSVLAPLRSLLAGSRELSVPHDDVKRRSQAAIAIVRTGEVTPYANVLLLSGVTF
jgi:D-ribose pyranase